MKKIIKSFLVVTPLACITLGTLTACQSRPELKQVSSDAPDKPVNTPETAANLKNKYEK